MILEPLPENWITTYYCKILIVSLKYLCDFDFYAVPFVWYLMTRKTEEAYVLVFSYIRNTIFTTAQIKNAMCDFEAGLSIKVFKWW